MSIKSQKKPNKAIIRQRNISFRKFLRDPLFLVLIFAIALLIAIFSSPLKLFFDPAFLVDYFMADSSRSVVSFIVIYTLLTVFGVPGILLTVAGGGVFGIWWGTLWSVLGATLGALGAFLVARYLLRDFIEQRFGQNKLINKFNQTIVTSPLNCVLAIRFAPVSPFNIVNFVLGLTPLNWLTYTIATFVGIIPGTLAYTWLGASGLDALNGSDRFSFFCALSFLTILSILPIFFKEKKVS